MVGPWHGAPNRMREIHLKQLKLSDYILADYAASALGMVNFLCILTTRPRRSVGGVAHTPRTCIPGGGWEIKKLTQVEVPGVEVYGAPLWANRVLIKKGGITQLVYSWFQGQDGC